MRYTSLKTEDGLWVARRVLMAHSFRERLVGLLRVKTLGLDEGLMLSPGASIHTFGMRYPIDAVFLNGQMKILKVAAHVAPWRVRVAPTDTKHVLEMSAGRARALGLNTNTFLCVDPDADNSLNRSDAPRHRPTTPLCAAPLRFSLRMPRNAADHHHGQNCNVDPQSIPGMTDNRPDEMAHLRFDWPQGDKGERAAAQVPRSARSCDRKDAGNSLANHAEDKMPQ